MNKGALPKQNKSLLPIIDWLHNYRAGLFQGDLIAGIIVAIILIPQAMAYAMLAGLPPQVGLYSCLLPIILYACMGSSRTLAIGPVGLISLIVGSTLSEMGLIGDEMALTVAVTLAFMSGTLLILMRLIHLGSVVNFISHPVLSGFTSAAALLIAFSQIKYLFGLEIPRTTHLHETVINLAGTLDEINVASASIGLTCIVIMITLRSKVFILTIGTTRLKPFTHILRRTGPLVAVVIGILAVWLLDLNKNSGVSIIANIPAGLPSLAIPNIDFQFIKQLLPVALLISIVGYLESISVSKVLASKRRQKIDADQELLAHGVANLGAAISGGYPVAGGFGRSIVNFTSGANTPVASLITALLMAITLIFLTPLLYYLPHTVLAAIIIIAVANLIDFKTFKHAWMYDKADAAALIFTFLMVLGMGIVPGILIGTCLSIALYLHRSSKPHIAIVGRVGNSEHFRNINRHDVKTCPHVIAMRVDENLYFANTNFLEEKIINLISEHQEVTDFVLICSAVNIIDTSALNTLDNLIELLREAEVTLHLAEVKGPVMDHLMKTSLLEKIKPGHIFLSTHEAMTTLQCT